VYFHPFDSGIYNDHQSSVMKHASKVGPLSRPCPNNDSRLFYTRNTNDIGRNQRESVNHLLDGVKIHNAAPYVYPNPPQCLADCLPPLEILPLVCEVESSLDGAD
jgi:hypothetical protein